MIVSSGLLEDRNSLQQAGGAGARRCKGTANALAEGPISQQDGLQDGRQVHAFMDNYSLAYYVAAELTRGRDGYCPPNLVSWGSTDFEFVRLECVWFYEQFILMRISHAPTVPAFGQAWVEYSCVPLFDVNAVEDFCDRTGLSANDLEQP